MDYYFTYIYLPQCSDHILVVILRFRFLLLGVRMLLHDVLSDFFHRGDVVASVRTLLWNFYPRVSRGSCWISTATSGHLKVTFLNRPLDTLFGEGVKVLA